MEARGDIESKMVQWCLAYKEAEGNSDLLLRSSDQATQKLCSKRVETVLAIENQLLAFDGLPGIPSVLERWILSKKNTACASCWLSSRREKQHEECERRIQEYFAADRALLDWSETISNQEAMG